MLVDSLKAALCIESKTDTLDRYQERGPGGFQKLWDFSQDISSNAASQLQVVSEATPRRLLSAEFCIY